MHKMLLSLVAIMFTGLPANAVVLFDNFAPGYGYSPTVVNWVGNTNTGLTQIVAIPFVSSATSQVSDLVMAVGEYSSQDCTGPTHTLLVYIKTDASGVPGVTLDTFTTFISAPFVYPNNLVTMTSTQHPTLTANTKYWLVAEANVLTGAANCQAMWAKNSIGDYGPALLVCQTTSGGCTPNGPWTLDVYWEPRDVFRLNGVPTYSICNLYDPTKPVKGGSTIPIKLQVCDVSGTNLSQSSLVLHATSVVSVSASISGDVQDAGNANPDSDFRFDSTLGGTGGYIFNLKTTGLTTGTYELRFVVGDDSSTYKAAFQVK
jgi:hypothetical protein